MVVGAAEVGDGVGDAGEGEAIWVGGLAEGGDVAKGLLAGGVEILLEVGVEVAHRDVFHFTGLGVM